MRQFRNTEFMSENMHGREFWEKHCVDGSAILKWIVKEMRMRV
jgi:hypothetical protein